MSLLKLPEIKASHAISKASFDTRPDALEKWQPEVRAAIEGDNTISIYNSIGSSWDGEGVTAKRISAALRAIGSRDVEVNINSPGGDFFEGVAIYNLLRQHPHKVTVKVTGLAASAASVIAMAGDEILMGDGAFLMIHNAWAVAIGNRHDMQETADTLAPFDVAMADVYAARSGMTSEEAAALMDKETWIGAKQAVADGFATALMDDSSITHNTQAQGEKKYLAMVETAMAKAGHTRSARREVFKSLFSGTPSAASDATPRAGDEEVAACISSLLITLGANNGN